jgi:hypothetical protein
VFPCRTGCLRYLLNLNNFCTACATSSAHTSCALALRPGERASFEDLKVYGTCIYTSNVWRTDATELFEALSRLFIKMSGTGIYFSKVASLAHTSTCQCCPPYRIQTSRFLQTSLRRRSSGASARLLNERPLWRISTPLKREAALAQRCQCRAPYCTAQISPNVRLYIPKTQLWSCSTPHQLHELCISTLIAYPETASSASRSPALRVWFRVRV